jgi:hypothetical protein
MSTTAFRSPVWKSATLTRQASEVRRSVWHELEPLRQTLAQSHFGAAKAKSLKTTVKIKPTKRSGTKKMKKKI